jgi:hypothetical protein
MQHMQHACSAPRPPLFVVQPQGPQSAGMQCCSKYSEYSQYYCTRATVCRRAVLQQHGNMDNRCMKQQMQHAHWAPHPSRSARQPQGQQSAGMQQHDAFWVWQQPPDATGTTYACNMRVGHHIPPRSAWQPQGPQSAGMQCCSK